MINFPEKNTFGYAGRNKTKYRDTCLPYFFPPDISPNLMDNLLNGTYMLCRWRSPDMSVGKNPLNPWLSRPLSHKKKKRELNSANKNIRLNFVHTTYRVSKICLIFFVFMISIKVAPKKYIYLPPSQNEWPILTIFGQLN